MANYSEHEHKLHFDVDITVASDIDMDGSYIDPQELVVISHLEFLMGEMPSVRGSLAARRVALRDIREVREEEMRPAKMAKQAVKEAEEAVKKAYRAYRATEASCRQVEKLRESQIRKLERIEALKREVLELKVQETELIVNGGSYEHLDNARYELEAAETALYHAKQAACIFGF